MRKLLIVVIVAAFGALAVSAAPAASPVENFRELAGYFPETTSIFGAVRTDDGVVDTLDGLIGNIEKFFPEGFPPNFSVRSLYDQQIAPGVTFGKSIRPWLGDAVAFGLTAPFGDMMTLRTPPILIAAQIRDADQAEAFFDSMFKQANVEDTYKKTVKGGFTVYTPQSTFSEGAIAIGESVLFVAPTAEGLPLTQPEKSLAGSETFQAAIGMLPAGGYDAVAYMDTPAINRTMLQQMGGFGFGGGARTRMMQTFMQLADTMYAAQGPQALGLTIMDGRSLVLDMSQLMGDTSKAEALGFTLTYATDPVDYAFAANIPADAPFVVQGTGIGPNVQNGFKNLRALGDYIQQSGLLGDLARESGDEHAAEFLNSFNLGHIVTFINLGFAGMTGLNLEKDVLAWMDGDYAFYLRAVPSKHTGAMPDGAVVVETSDAAATQNVVDKLGEAFDQYRVPYTRDSNERRTILELPDVIRALIPPDERERFESERQLDVLMGANGEVFAMGTRAGVQFSLNPDGGLASDATYKDAQALFVPDAQVVMYLTLRPLIPLLDDVAGLNAQEERVLSLLESASLSAHMSEAGSVGRLVITISDEPLARTQ